MRRMNFSAKARGALMMLAITVLTISPCMASDEEREARQAELDAACESARAEKLIPMRQAMVQKCVVEEEFETQEACEAFYADYGERAGGRPAFFYDLPQCVEAFDYAQSERSGD